MYQNTVKQLIDNITGSSGIGYQPNDTYNEKNNAINEIASDSQSSTDTSAFGGVLSSLMKLRLICNSAMDSNASIKDFIESGNTEKLLELSAKLQVLSLPNYNAVHH